MKQPSIVVKGARAHNLKDVDIEIPKNKLIVMTGLSGSGKSSLAFDTIYAEGQRRYVESLSAYARQFLGQMDKPDVDTIEGLSPAISIDQRVKTQDLRLLQLLKFMIIFVCYMRVLGSHFALIMVSKLNLKLCNKWSIKYYNLKSVVRFNYWRL